MPSRFLRAFSLTLALLLTTLALGACSRLLGWGVLLWSLDDRGIPSGTVLPVYIKSNINQVWVAEVPKGFSGRGDKIEIPLWQLELSGGRRAAAKKAAAFAEYARTYAETLQDGLPIREKPDNSSRRVYRLKEGEILKILSQVPPEEGVPAISGSGEPLPGEWYLVMAQDGSRGYCFSYRLHLFEYRGGALAEATEWGENGEKTDKKGEDPELEAILAKAWSPESYGAMSASGRFDLEELSKGWYFDPGADTGAARIHHPDVDRTFTHRGIKGSGSRFWYFDDAPLQMTLRSENLLAVQFSENGGPQRTLLFVALPVEVKDLITQEKERRAILYQRFFAQEGGGPFMSANYGSLSFTPRGTFSWTGNNRLVPQALPRPLSRGTVDLGLYQGVALEDRFEGVLTLSFEDPAAEGGAVKTVFLYRFDGQGLRLEYVPPQNVEGVSVARRAETPLVIFLFKVSKMDEGKLPAERIESAESAGNSIEENPASDRHRNKRKRKR